MSSFFDKICQGLSFSLLAGAVRRSGKADSHHGQRGLLAVMFFDLSSVQPGERRGGAARVIGLAKDIAQQFESLPGLLEDRR